MELKEGMYVRNHLGNIGKIVEEYTHQNYKVSYLEPQEWVLDTGYVLNEALMYNNEDIIKASNNIIDLIEENDLIKCQFGEQTLILQVGARHTTLHQVNDWVKGVFTPDNEFWSLKYLYEEDILQSIVTKEQFKAMEYVVGGSDD